MAKEFGSGIKVVGPSTNSSGIQMTRLTSASTDSTGKTLGVDASGNIVKVAGLQSSDLGTPNGPASLDGTGYVVKSQLGSGTPSGTTYLRGDGTWATPSGGGGGSPGGADLSLQYNNGGAFAGAGNVQVSNGDLAFVPYEPGTSTAVPSNGTVLFAQKIAERRMLSGVGPSGIDYAFQPFIARNKIGIWMPPGNATTVPGVFGITAFTATGTATSRSVATTRLFTRMRRLGYVSAATAGSLCGARIAVAQFTTGTGGALPMGGFHIVVRFGTSDAATVAGARQYVGVSSSTAAPTNVEPSTLTNCCGVGHGAADTNLKIFYGAGTAQTPIDLGANFPANTLSVDLYELSLFSPPSATTTIHWQVTRLNTGHVATGSITANLPASTTLLTGLQAWRTNNATALAVGLDIASYYIETDY